MVGKRFCLALAAVVIFFHFSAPYSFSDFYRWVDKKGWLHISDFPNPNPPTEKTAPPFQEPARTPNGPDDVLKTPVTIFLKPQKDVYSPNEEIEVAFSGLPGNQQDWITLIKSNMPEDKHGEWLFTKGKKDGRYRFKGLPAGHYEVRVYLDWPKGGHKIVARQAIKVVQIAPASEKQERLPSQ